MVNATLICKFHCDLMDTGGGVGKLQGKSVECSYRSPKTIDRFFCVHGVLYPSDDNTGANHEMIQRHNQQLKEELSNVGVSCHDNTPCCDHEHFPPCHAGALSIEV
jgi:Tfp pilus assembly protein PilV